MFCYGGILKLVDKMLSKAPPTNEKTSLKMLFPFTVIIQNTDYVRAHQLSSPGRIVCKNVPQTTSRCGLSDLIPKRTLGVFTP